ncbi:translation initiation factor IF-2-like [Mesocricetus auratus]|uniref:Translation initiation factor IF-2-like n=1 Tax=Mesocricetus auratus TaxID=10036 RepID=A0ABM2WVM2_MESAU|nr:translation initiation factor IF-2-like [Mesocricetus auratus]XP_040592558.1 translation initiation factor IF-2-like [Mesocricetus auratus]
METLKSATRAPCSQTAIPQHSKSQHESEVSKAPRSCIPAFTHQPSNLCPPHTHGLPNNSVFLAVYALGDRSGSPGHRRRRTQSLSLYTRNFSHTQTSFSVSVPLRVAHTPESPSHPQLLSSRSGFFRHTHTGSPSRSRSRSFLFHTQPSSHLGSCTLTRPPGVSPSHTRAGTRARASSSHHRPLRAPRSRRPPLRRGVPPARPPPHALSGSHPARGDGGPAERSAAHGTVRAGPEPAPGRNGASEPLTSSSPQDSSRVPALPGYSVAQPPKPRPRHVTRTGSRQRAPLGDPARSGGFRRRCFRAPGGPRAVPEQPPAGRARAPRGP